MITSIFCFNNEYIIQNLDLGHFKNIIGIILSIILIFTPFERMTCDDKSPFFEWELNFFIVKC
jgi:hypothetical protein